METKGSRTRTWLPWLGAGLVVGIVLPLALVSPALGLCVLATATAVGLILVGRRVRILTEAQEKASHEIGILARQLLKVETLANNALRARIEPQAALPPPGADVETLAAGIQDVTAEIGLLSGIVRELASVVAAQDGEIQRVKQAPPPFKPVPGVATQERRPAPQATVTPLPFVVADRSRDAALVAAFDDSGLEVWLQPVVTLPQRKVVSYEALARLRVADEVLAPETFLPVLERHGRSTLLDRRMLKSVVTIARHLQQRGSQAAIGYALSPLSLFEPGFLRSLKTIFGDDANLSGRVAIALPQASWRTLDAEQTALLQELHGRFLFALDRPADLRFDTGFLTERGVVQIKVPAALLQSAARRNLSDIAVEDLVAAIGRAGIRLVVTEVERDAEIPELIDLDVPLAQGTVFANPRAVRPDVLSTAAVETPGPGPVTAELSDDPEPEPPRIRRPFRDFLRRAV